MKNVVLITSISHRRESLIQVLEALERQTLRPDRVLLRLDGWPANRDELPSIINVGKLVYDVWFDGMTPNTRGAGRRWHHPVLLDLDADTIVHTIDDDLVPHEHYIADTTHLLEHYDAAITWHGWPNEQRALEFAYFAKPTDDTEVVTAGAGASAYRWAWVEGLRHTYLAPALLNDGPQCDDDALLSFYLWSTGRKIIRGAGAAPLTETADSRGPSASFHAHAGHRHGQRLALAIAFAWPGLDSVLDPELCELYRKNTGGQSLVESGISRVFDALPPGETRRRAGLRFLDAVERQYERFPKNAPSFARQLVPLLRELEVASRAGTLHTPALYFIGAGRWTLWTALAGSLLDVDVIHMTQSPVVAQIAPIWADVRHIDYWEQTHKELSDHQKQFRLWPNRVVAIPPCSRPEPLRELARVIAPEGRIVELGGGE